MQIRKNKTYRGWVENLNSDGAGVVRIDGYTFFVEGSLIGEDISFKAIKVNKSLGYGKLEEIHEPSEYRIDLGEDSWVKTQVMPLGHLAYDQQLIYKTNEVYQVFKRIGKFQELKVEACLGMTNPYHYRNKAQVPVQEIGARLETGVFRRRSHDLIPLENTFITNIEIDRLVVHIRDIMRKYEIRPYNEASHSGSLRHIVVKRGYHSGEIMVVLVLKEKDLKNEGKIIKEILSFSGNLVSIIKNIQEKKTNVIMGKASEVLWGQDYYTDSMLGLDFMISEKSFYQVNTSQAEKLYQIALKAANLRKDDVVLDAYCGIGTITLNIAKEVREVYGVEIVGQAIEMANKNAQLNNINNAKFITGKAEEILPELKKKNIYFDAVFVDPPRKGLEKTFIDTLIQMNIPKLVYISCNPATQGRDCHILKEAGYKLDFIQPVDMFPQTSHIETIALLQREIS